MFELIHPTMTLNCPCGFNAVGPAHEVSWAGTCHHCEKTDRSWGQKYEPSIYR